jgi:hypothetical protein
MRRCAVGRFASVDPERRPSRKGDPSKEVELSWATPTSSEALPTDRCSPARTSCAAPASWLNSRYRNHTPEADVFASCAVYAGDDATTGSVLARTGRNAHAFRPLASVQERFEVVFVDADPVLGALISAACSSCSAASFAFSGSPIVSSKCVRVPGRSRTRVWLLPPHDSGVVAAVFAPSRWMALPMLPRMTHVANQRARIARAWA